jgi:membrane-bound metal-dependent hydrolase YbcI (DUF457 family)
VLSPDLDSLAKLWDPMASIAIHRVATHSFLGGIPIALAVAGLIWLMTGDRFWRLTGLAYVGLLSHVVLDAFTPFGTALLWPLDRRRWSVGSLHVVDPAVGLILVAGLLLTARWGHVAARVTLVALGAYLLLGVATMKIAEIRWAQALEREAIVTIRRAVVPVAPGPLRWLGVAETPDAAIRTRFWIWEVTPRGATVERRQPGPSFAGADEHPAVRAFLERARVPWRRAQHDGESWTIEYEDLAFEDHPFGGPMILRLRVDASGVVRAVEVDHKF